MATPSVNRGSTLQVERTAGFENGEEAALHYVEAALQAHRQSFGDDEEENRKMEWAVTGLLERAVQILNADVYGEA